MNRRSIEPDDGVDVDRDNHRPGWEHWERQQEIELRRRLGLDARGWARLERMVEDE